jgi:hypothetical protein
MKKIIYLFAVLAFGTHALAQETKTETTEEKKEETQEFKISAEIRPEWSIIMVTKRWLRLIRITAYPSAKEPD